MFKKTPHKRKIRSIIRQIIFSFFIFFITLICLLVFYFTVSLKKNQIINPIGVLGTQFFKETNTDGNIKKITGLLKKNGIQIFSAVPSENDTTTVTLEDDQEVIFANKKDLNQQIASLQLITRRLTIEGKRFDRIDFRFDNPVVTF